MKIMPCPLNGPRNIQEFVCAGPVEPHPDPNRCTDDEWAEYVWLEENVAGVVREWWCHVATSYWFIAERNTVSDEILATYPASKVFAERVDFEPRPEAAAPPPEAVPAAAEARPEPAKEAAPPPEAPPEAPPAPEPQPEAAETAPEAPEAPAPQPEAAVAAPAADAPAAEAPASDGAPGEPRDPAT